MPFRNYVELTDPDTIRALAHPARAAILAKLYDHGPATATECAEAAGESPSSCSYHLRTLAKLGFVEEAESDDGRERRWRVTVGGFGIPKEAQDSPEVLSAARVWMAQWVEKNQEILAAYLADEESYPPAWRKAATMYAGTGMLTPEQVLELGERFLELLREYTEGDAQPPAGSDPAGARRVHVALTAVPWAPETRPPGEGRRG